MSDFTGTPGNDTLTGTGDPDTLEGLAGDDILDGGAGDDLLIGGPGNDLIVGGAGNDQIAGGTGIDTLDYSSAAAGVTANLAISGFQDTGGAGSDLIGGIDILVGSHFNDVLTGTRELRPTTLNGGDGDDILRGHDGGGVLIGGPGADTFSFAALTDLRVARPNLIADFNPEDHLDLSALDADPATAGVQAYTLVAALDGHAGQMAYEWDAPNNQTRLVFDQDGDAVADGLLLIAGQHDDAPPAPATPGPDVITGTTLADILEGLGGDDLYIVNHLGDVVVEAPGGGHDSVRASVSYTLGDNVENLTLVGSAVTGTGNNLANRIFGDDLANILSGGSDNDILKGKGGDDVLFSGNGNDRLEGGDGVDTADYAHVKAAVIVDLSDTARQDTGGGGFDLLIGIETLKGSTYGDTLTNGALSGTVDGYRGDDVITGGGGYDILIGGDGDDTIDVGAGSAWMKGGNGDDVLRGGLGKDNFEGGSGTDTADYSQVASAVTVDLTKHNYQQTGGGGLDKLNGIETLVGSDFNDLLTASGLAATVEGGAGDDTLVGKSGGGTLIGGSGADTFKFVALADLSLLHPTLIADLNPEDHLDLSALDADPATAGVQAYTLVAALDGHAGQMAYEWDPANNRTRLVFDQNGDSIRDGLLLIAGQHDDTPVAPATAGADIMTGTSAGDTLAGLGGDDFYVLNKLEDRVIEAPGEGHDTVQSGLSYALAPNVEDLILIGSATTGAGNDRGNRIVGNDLANTLSGGSNNDILAGKGGDDVLQSGRGNDHLDGGDGADTADYSLATGAVTVDASDTARQNTGGAGQDLLTSIEGLKGSHYDDTLTNGALSGKIDGYKGNDHITGGGRHDVLNGGAGNDLIEVGAGTATVRAGSGDDLLRGGGGADLLDGGTGNDRVDYSHAGAAVTVNLYLTNYQDTGGAGTDRLIGIERLIGSNFDDLLTGADVNGGGGKDTLVAHAGAILTGGTGADTFRFDSLDASPGINRDTITDLHAEDRIDLSAIDANTALAGDQAFTKVAAFDGHAGQLTFALNSALNLTTLLLDVNGDSNADAVILLSGRHDDFTGFVF